MESCLILYYIITTPSLYRLTEIAPSTTYQEQGDIQNNMSGKCYQNFQDTFSRQPCGTYIIYYCTPASYSRNSISGYYRRVATVAVYFMFLLWTALFRSPLKSRIVPHWNILPPARPSPLCFVRSYRKHLMVQLVPGIILTSFCFSSAVPFGPTNNAKNGGWVTMVFSNETRPHQSA